MTSGALSPLLILLVQLVVVVSVSRIVGSIAHRLGQSRVIGEMLAGFLLGPSLLGAVAPELSSSLFPVRGLGTLESLSTLGLVLYLLLVGARMDPDHLRSKGVAVVATSLGGTIVPFILGMGVGLPLATRFGVPESSRMIFLVFMGLALSVTALPMLVRIVHDLSLDSTPLGTSAIAAAAIADVFAWAGLAIVTSLVRSPEASIGLILVRIVAFVVTMTLIVGPILRRALRRSPSEESRTGWVLVSALASAATTEWIGIHPLFGAFLVGLIVSREAGLPKALTQRLEPVTTQLLLPIFFALTGLRMDVGQLSLGDLLVELALISGVAILGKIGGPALAARLGGLSWREGLVIGTLMNARGLVEVALLVVGLETGLLPRPLFTVLVLMAFVTTAMTAPVLRLLGMDMRTAPHAASVSPDPA